MAHDLRCALRILWRHPGFTATVVAVLALAIAANAVAFSLVNSLFLRPPAGVRDPDSLVRIYATYENGPRYFTVSYADYLDARALGHVFADVIADEPTALHLTAAGRSDRLWAYRVGGQVALCVVLLAGAGLCLRSLSNAHRIDPGFEPDGVVMASLSLGPQGYDDQQAARFWRDLVRRVSVAPGIDAVGLANRIRSS